ncbi:hypothetical protein WL22_10500 [Burkholderia ubonensis]|nr:hypothetical protein WL22_10500 [Burkholderia ubonensis]
MNVKALALSLPPEAFQFIHWREGTNQVLSNRFAALRVRHAGGNAGKVRLRPEQWLLIEWPPEEDEPSKYYLSTLPVYLKDVLERLPTHRADDIAALLPHR